MVPLVGGKVEELPYENKVGDGFGLEEKKTI